MNHVPEHIGGNTLVETTHQYHIMFFRPFHDEHSPFLILTSHHLAHLRVEIDDKRNLLLLGDSQELVKAWVKIQRLLSKADRAGSKGVEVNPKGIKPTQRDLLTGQCTKHELWERRVRMGESNLFIDRDVAAAVNLLFHSPETGERDAAGMATFLEAVKPCWLDSGVIVEVEAANRLSERELRKILRNGIPSVSVERLDRKKFLSGVCDAESKKALSKASGGSESPPNSETPLL